jgi:gliding motility-associated lipoprotein GldH
MRNKFSAIQWLVSVGLLVLSCTDTAVVDRHISIEDRAWHYDNQPEVAAHITDAAKPYNIYLNLRHTPSYRYSNIFVLVHQSGPGSRDTTERIELRLAEPDGRWLGRGGGSLYTHQHLIKEQVRFPDTGVYRFRLEQNMRENPLHGVADVGIRIAPVE